VKRVVFEAIATFLVSDQNVLVLLVFVHFLDVVVLGLLLSAFAATFLASAVVVVFAVQFSFRRLVDDVCVCICLCGFFVCFHVLEPVGRTADPIGGIPRQV